MALTTYILSHGDCEAATVVGSSDSTVVSLIVVVVDPRRQSVCDQWICVCGRHHVDVVSTWSLVSTCLNPPLTHVHDA